MAAVATGNTNGRRTARKLLERRWDELVEPISELLVVRPPTNGTRPRRRPPESTPTVVRAGARPASPSPNSSAGVAEAEEADSARPGASERIRERIQARCRRVSNPSPSVA